MRKFQYYSFSWHFATVGGIVRTEKIDSECVKELNQRLNELGRDGWELCAAVQIDQGDENSGGDFAVYTCRREYVE